jgi:kynurenine formamidase
MLNLIGADSMREIVSEADASRVFDLAVDYFIGMPSWTGFGDPSFQIWMSHTPSGSIVDNVVGVERSQNELVSYSGDCITMYTHCGTHLDTLAHFGYRGLIWNGFSEKEHLGSRHWRACGAEKHPPIIARGVLLDVAATEGVEVLPAGFVIGAKELQKCQEAQGTQVRPGDVVLLRTGRMRLWPDPEAYIPDEPGLDREGAEYLAKAGAILIGGDNIALEVRPSGDPDNFHVVHTYLLAEAGIPILELVNLEELAAEKVTEFAFVGAGLKIRGGTGAPMRPLAMPLRK